MGGRWMGLIIDCFNDKRAGGSELPVLARMPISQNGMFDRTGAMPHESSIYCSSSSSIDAATEFFRVLMRPFSGSGWW
jgi:hypothetical protein